MTVSDDRQPLVARLLEDSSAWAEVQGHKIALDGRFTAQRLRELADIMDRKCDPGSNTPLRRELDAARDVIMAVALGDAARIDVSAYVEGRVDNVPMDPVHGGCWFCRRSGTDAFCKGWDAYYHVECLEAEKKNCPDNPELTEFP